MVSISVSVPEELRQRMEKHPDINWSAVARKAFEDHVEKIEFFKKLVSKSKLTEKDAKEIADKINENVGKRLLAKMKQKKRK
ncbi:hypothetical protein JW968_03405 [Candidatus Woesearchaeota archaeon]|nr:hypothetical protein [Candidatus Woesearchaeota archaeon]